MVKGLPNETPTIRSGRCLPYRTTSVKENALVTMIIARLYLIRHGQTDSNKKGVYQGQTDTVLNDEGIQQSRIVSERLKDVRFQAAFSSDLSRATKVRNATLNIFIPVHKREICCRRQN
jgi:bisphosphoglycerate-dependent phosphoglycerate mutase